MITQQDIEALRIHFLHKSGGAISGHVLPATTEAINLGSAAQRFDTVYAKTIIADSITGTGSSGGDADTVDGIHASTLLTAGYLLPLDALGVFPPETYNQALLVDGTRTLSGHLVVSPGFWLDGVDVSEHSHSGVVGHGSRINHLDLLNNDADVHPQYPQWGLDEIVTGEWMFTDLLDRSAGWKFVPSEQAFKAVPHNLSLIANPTEAKIQLGPLSDIELLANGTDAFIRVGVGDDVVKLSTAPATYRLWAGKADPALAPFSVTKTGFLKSVAGELGGWSILPEGISSTNVSLLSAGELRVGSGGANPGTSTFDIVTLSAIDANGWRLWSGNTTPTSAPFRVNKWGQVFLGDARVSGTLKSSNYVSGISGFAIDATGRAEFNNIIARGRIETAVFSEKKISAISGTVIVAEAASLKEAVTNTDTEIVVDSDIFAANDIILIKGNDFVALPGGGWQITNYTEHMKVIGEPVLVAEDRFIYSVVRDLAEVGKGTFKVGEAFVRQGNASQARAMLPVASGAEDAAFGSYQPGGSGTVSEGGWLVLEGSRGVGPYFGVARRRGPIWNQFDEVVRIGNLKGIGFLDAGRPDTNPYYGMVVGDAAAYWAYDPDAGLRIKTRSGKTTIDNQGIASDELALLLPTETPGFIEDRARFYLYKDVGLPPRVGVKIQVDGVQTTLSHIGDMLTSDWDANNDGIIDVAALANAVAWANVTGKPASFTPSAHTHTLSQITDYAPFDPTELLSRAWIGL
jgi:hypothetical protein